MVNHHDSRYGDIYTITLALVYTISTIIRLIGAQSGARAEVSLGNFKGHLFTECGCVIHNILMTITLNQRVILLVSHRYPDMTESDLGTEE